MSRRVNLNFIGLREIDAPCVSHLPLKEFILKFNYRATEKIIAHHLGEIEQLLMKRYPYKAKTNIFQRHYNYIEVYDNEDKVVMPVLQMWV